MPIANSRRRSSRHPTSRRRGRERVTWRWRGRITCTRSISSTSRCVERRRGDADAALAQFNRAVALDASDAIALAQAGELLEERGDFQGAETAYRNAATADPFAGYDKKAEAVAAKAREARLPAEFRAI